MDLYYPSAVCTLGKHDCLNHLSIHLEMSGTAGASPCTPQCRSYKCSMSPPPRLYRHRCTAHLVSYLHAHRAFSDVFTVVMTAACPVTVAAAAYAPATVVCATGCARRRSSCCSGSTPIVYVRVPCSCPRACAARHHSSGSEHFYFCGGATDFVPHVVSVRSRPRRALSWSSCDSVSVSAVSSRCCNA